MREGKRVNVFGGEVLWGKAPVKSRGGKKYFITFIDHKTRLTHLYLLKTKDKTLKVYKQYEAWVKTQMGAKIKVLNTDRGGVYQGEEFVTYLKSKGTHQKLNVHDTPQHAGVAERRNRTIGKRIRALLHASGLPKFLTYRHYTVPDHPIQGTNTVYWTIRVHGAPRIRECDTKLAVLYPPPQFPSGTEQFRAVPSGSECFRVFPIIFQLSSECFRVVLSNSKCFQSFPIYFIKN